MISKYSGTCSYCSNPTKAGKDHYDLDSKQGYHAECREKAESEPTPEQWELATRLDFGDHARCWLDQQRCLFLLPVPSGEPAPEPEREDLPTRGLFGALR